MLPVPLAVLNAVAKFLGKADVAMRLLGNLQIDMAYTFKTLGWQPPIGVSEGLRRAAQVGEK
jgi:UDP-glucose 4-epimerase